MMSDRCEHCPCPVDVPCDGTLCEWAATGEPLKLKHIVGRSRIKANMPEPQPVPLAPVAIVGSGVPRPCDLTHEIVVARYKENLGWLNKAKHFISVYDKGGQGNAYGLTVPHAYMFLENRGREAGSFLSHIATHYDSLADRTYFCQGDGLTHELDLLGRMHYDFEEPTPLCREYRVDFPPRQIKQRDRIEMVGGMEIHYGDALDAHGKNADGQAWMNPAAWSKVFATPRPEQIWFGYAATWCVPKSSITHRPREFWQWLLGEVSKAKNEIDVWDDVNPLTAWAMEGLWACLWAPEYVTAWQPMTPAERNRERLQAAYAARADAIKARMGGCGCGKK